MGTAAAIVLLTLVAIPLLVSLIARGGAGGHTMVGCGHGHGGRAMAQDDRASLGALLPEGSSPGPRRQPPAGAEHEGTHTRGGGC